MGAYIRSCALTMRVPQVVADLVGQTGRTQDHISEQHATEILQNHILESQRTVRLIKMLLNIVGFEDHVFPSSMRLPNSFGLLRVRLVVHGGIP